MTESGFAHEICPPMPSSEDFEKFFAYTAYDTITERFNHLRGLRYKMAAQAGTAVPGDAPQPQIAYKKFVQSNKELPWARDLLASVARVQAARAHCRIYFPMLVSRNMHALHKVCVDISSNNTPPHKEFCGFERCYVTQVWHERCLDVSRCSRGSSAAAATTATTTTTPRPETPTAGASTPASPCAISAPGTPSLSCSTPLPSPPPATAASDAVTAATSPSPSIAYTTMTPTRSSVYISPKFKHFAQMLWTAVRIDHVVRNYSIEWFHTHSQQDELRSVQDYITDFENGDHRFRDELYRIFLHAVSHVCVSLHEHIHAPLFTNESASNEMEIEEPAFIGSGGLVSTHQVPYSML
jgi:hypothetical protein